MSGPYSEPLLAVRSSPLFVVESYSSGSAFRDRLAAFVQILALSSILSFFIPVGCTLPNPWDKVRLLVPSSPAGQCSLAQQHAGTCPAAVGGG